MSDVVAWIKAEGSNRSRLRLWEEGTVSLPSRASWDLVKDLVKHRVFSPSDLLSMGTLP